MKPSHSLRNLPCLCGLLGLLAGLPADAAVTAADDGSTGAPFATTDEDSLLDTSGGVSVTTNDSGDSTFSVFSFDAFSADGAAVAVNPDGTFTYDPTTSGAAQALATGASLTDTFSYEIKGPAPATGITLALDATTGTDTFPWGGKPALVDASGSLLPPSIIKAYEFSGTRATRNDFQQGGAYDLTSASFEFWLKADVLQNQTLFETGGSGIGSGVYLNAAGTVSYIVKTSTPVSVTSSSAMVAGQWHHVVATIEITGGVDTLAVYIDGNPAGTNSSSSTLSDWSGTDDAGLGGVNGDEGGDNANPGNLQNNGYGFFDGQVSIFNFYSGKVLSAAEVNDNYTAVANASVDTATVTVEVTGANDAPGAVNDTIVPAIFEDGTLVSTADLTENDGAFRVMSFPAGSDLTRAGITGVTVSQSPSTGAPPGGGVPENAIDGNFGNFTHTDSGTTSGDHSWEIDFGRVVSMEDITLYNRADCCGDRMRDLTVTVEDAGGAVIFTSLPLNPGNIEGFTGSSGGQLFVDFGGPILGQTVVVTRARNTADTNQSNGSILSLGEVTITGSTDFAPDMLLFDHDARYTAGAGVWENHGSAGGSQANWTFTGGVTLNGSPGSAFPGITAAYDFDGIDGAGTFDGGAPEQVLGNAATTANAALEIWFKPGNLTQTATLVEYAGTTGSGLALEGNLLVAGSTGGGRVTYDLAGDPLGLLGAGATSEYLQAMAVFAVEESSPQLRLYVNGTLVAWGSMGTDWASTDGSGMGRFSGTHVGGILNNGLGSPYDTFFDGSIAQLRLYGSLATGRPAFTGAQAMQNYLAVTAGTDVDGDSFAVSGIVDASDTLQAQGVPATLASGALVTLDSSTGAFTYDPNGQFEFLGLGESTTDSFTYRIDDGLGATGDAIVTVTITGKNDPIADTIAADEEVVTRFPANALVGNDQRTPTTPGAYFDVNPGSISGSTWLNDGSAGAGQNVNMSGGTAVSPPVLGTNFGALGAAWLDPRGLAASLDAISLDDASFEIWFRPAQLTTGRQTLYETGGNGNGFSIVYDANQREVTTTVDGGNDTTAIIQVTVGGISTGEFNQIIAVYDKDSGGGVEDTLTLYLNNDPTAAFNATPAGTATNIAGIADDFAGTDGGGIGVTQGTAARNEALSPFQGEIAIARVYTSVLSTAEMEANYDAAVQPITLIGGSGPGNSITTTLGATVTFNADGSFDYDGSTLSADIAPGAVSQDSFTYTISDGAGGSSSTTVTVDVTGVDESFLARDDAQAVSEDGPAAAIAVLGNDSYTTATVKIQALVANFATAFESGTAVGQTADFTGTSGWSYLWNAPSDWDGTTSLDASTGPFGTAADYELLKWTGTRWTPDGDEDTGNGSPAGYLRLASDGGHPGLGASDAGTTTPVNSLARGPIAAYTVPAGADGVYAIADSFLRKPSTSGDSVSAVVYVNDTHIGTVPVSPGGSSSFDTVLGALVAGDVIYVGVSADATAGNDTFEWDFDIVTVPDASVPLNSLLGSVSTDGTTVTYDPGSAFEALAVGQSAQESFVYLIDDGAGKLDTATVTVTVDGANDAPQGVADNNATDENTAVAGTVLGNDTDIDAGDYANLVVSKVEGSAANIGTAVVLASGATVTMQADGSYVYDPNGAFAALADGEADVDTFTYTVQDGHGADAAAATTVTVDIAGLYTPIEGWRVANGLPADGSVPGSDTDDLDELLEFGFGTDPNANDQLPLSWDGTNPAVPGTPVAEASFPGGGGVDVMARFMRRKDFDDPGSVHYTLEFSSDLTDWETSDDVPTPAWVVPPVPLADDASGDYELVEVPYPLFLGNFKKARFFRVTVTEL